MGEATKKMTYVRLGKSGLKVSKIILGCMSYGSSEWRNWILDEKTGIEHIKAACITRPFSNVYNRHSQFDFFDRYDAGIQTFDTADVYSNGESEKILGKAIKELKLPRDEIVVMTKIHGKVGKTPGTIVKPESADQEGYVNQYGLSRKHIFDGVKKSLERLQLDYIDVFQCHRFDNNTPIEETMQALHDVVQAGYVRYIGMSSCWAWQFHAMQNYAIANHLTPFISMQNQYSLAYREEEREMMPTLKHFGVGCIPWSPLARGFLTRPPSAESTARGSTDGWAQGYAKNGQGNLEVVKRVEELARKKEKSMAQIALAWILSKDSVTAPIIGTTSLQNLAELLEAVHIELSSEEMAYLEQPYVPQSVFGHS